MVRTCRPGRPGEQSARQWRAWDDRLARFVRDHGGAATLSGFPSSSGLPFHECRLDTTLGAIPGGAISSIEVFSARPPSIAPAMLAPKACPAARVRANDVAKITPANRIGVNTNRQEPIT